MIQAPSYGQFLSSQQYFSNETLHPLFKFQQEYLDLIARFFMILDHPESEESLSHTLSLDSLITQLKSLINHASRVTNEYRKKRRFFNGFTILLAGFPNSGKSSLFNRLLKDNRAIVSPVPGTTRDLVEGRLTFPSGDVILLDSAGLRPTSEAVEQEGIQKTRKMLQQADFILWISSPDHPDVGSIQGSKNLKTKMLHLWNKSDLSLPSASLADFDHVVSAKTRKGLPSLVKHIERLSEDFYRTKSVSETGSLDSDRQLEVLSRVLRFIKPVPGFLTTDHFDLALHSLEEGRKVLDDGVGLVPASDIYDRVFRMFCLGK
jgi:tRNA modification GTPase